MNPFEFVTNAVRAKEIVTVLVRHGFGEIVQQLNLPPGLLQRMVTPAGPRHTTWARIRLAIEELGPTFVKVGQLLSTRPDVIPQPLVLELRNLQANVPPAPLAAMREVVQEELGASVETIFLEFGDVPIAAGSLAHVYRARLNAGGRIVAVKVQRPELHKVIDPDLDLIRFFAAQIHQRVPALQPYDLPAVAEEIREVLLRELDFANEARNLRFFNATNPYPDHVFAPEVIEALSTSRVLVQSLVEGRRIDDPALGHEARRRLATEGARSLFHQVMVHGFFHADPHPGNMLVAPDGRLCLLDWGMVGQLTRRMRHFLADLFEAAATGDAERLVAIAGTLASPGARPDYREMEKAVTFALREDFNPALGEEQIGRIILKLLNIFSRNGIAVTRDYSLMAKAVVSIEETGRTLDPQFDLRRIAAPVVRTVQRERTSPLVLLRRLRSGFAFGLGKLGDLPSDISRIARRISQDDLTIKFQHKGLEELDDALNTAASRLTLAIILGSLLIASSLIVTTGIKPLLFGFPALGIVGYIVSGLLGLWIVWDIVRHGRHK